MTLEESTTKPYSFTISRLVNELCICNVHAENKEEAEKKAKELVSSENATKNIVVISKEIKSVGSDIKLIYEEP